MNPAAIAAMVELFQELEPEVQLGISKLVSLVHKKQLTAQDFLDQATALVNKASIPAPATPPPSPGGNLRAPASEKQAPPPPNLAPSGKPRG